MEKVSIAVCITDNHPYLQKEFALSLYSLLGAFYNWAHSDQSPDGYEYEVMLISPKTYGGVDDMRNSLAKDAIKDGADYILWLDTDMIFPQNTLYQLLLDLHASKGLDGVSGMYTYKTPPYMPHIYVQNSDKKYVMPSEFPTNEPMQVDGVAFGCLLMRTSSFERSNYPWFRFETDESGKMVGGEDLLFCQDIGFKGLVDPRVNCKHIRSDAYDLADFIRFSKLTVEDSTVKISKEQVKKIMRQMPHLQNNKSVK